MESQFTREQHACCVTDVIARDAIGSAMLGKGESSGNPAVGGRHEFI